jgi:hypothetical protein
VRRFGATVLYLLIGLPLALSSILALSVRPWALDRDFYRRALADEKLFTILRSPEAASSFDEKIVIGGYIFSGPAFATAIQAHLPEAELRQAAMAGVDSFLDAAAKGRAPMPVDLRPLKARLAKDSPVLVRDYIAALPKAPDTAPPAGAQDLSLAFPAISKAQQEKALALGFGKVLAGMPDSLEAKTQSAGNPAPAILGGAQASLDRIAFVGTGISAFLLLGLGFLGGGGLARTLSRTGRFIILPSAVVLVIGTALALPGAPLLGFLPTEATRALGSPFVDSLRSWASS